MSEWYEVTDKDDVELSDDGKSVDVLFNTNDFGNQYVQIPIDIIANILPHSKELEELREKVRKYFKAKDVCINAYYISDENYTGERLLRYSADQVNAEHYLRAAVEKGEE